MVDSRHWILQVCNNTWTYIYIYIYIYICSSLFRFNVCVGHHFRLSASINNDKPFVIKNVIVTRSHLYFLSLGISSINKRDIIMSNLCYHYPNKLRHNYAYVFSISEQITYRIIHGCAGIPDLFQVLNMISCLIS